MCRPSQTLQHHNGPPYIMCGVCLCPPSCVKLMHPRPHPHCLSLAAHLLVGAVREGGCDEGQGGPRGGVQPQHEAGGHAQERAWVGGRGGRETVVWRRGKVGNRMSVCGFRSQRATDQSQDTSIRLWGLPYGWGERTQLMVQYVDCGFMTGHRAVWVK